MTWVKPKNKRIQKFQLIKWKLYDSYKKVDKKKRKMTGCKKQRDLASHTWEDRFISMLLGPSDAVTLPLQINTISWKASEYQKNTLKFGHFFVIQNEIFNI